MNNLPVKQEKDNRKDISLITLNVGRPIRRSHKLTPAKRKEIIEYLLNTGYNISGAAMKVGVAPNSIYDLMERDANFKSAVNQVKTIYLDSLEDVSMKVASVPSRDGFNDRKLMLQAHRRDQYLPDRQTNINVGIQVNNTTSVPEIRQNLQRYSMLIDSDNVTDAHFQDIDNNV